MSFQAKISYILKNEQHIVHADRFPFWIGRSSQNQLIINDPSVSGQHAILEMMGQSLVLRDLGSTNGILSNGKRHGRLTLKGQMSFHLGDVKFEIRITQQTATEDKTRVAHPLSPKSIEIDHFSPKKWTPTAALAILGMAVVEQHFLGNPIWTIPLTLTTKALGGTIGALWFTALARLFDGGVVFKAAFLHSFGVTLSFLAVSSMTGFLLPILYFNLDEPQWTPLIHVGEQSLYGLGLLYLGWKSVASSKQVSRRAKAVIYATVGIWATLGLGRESILTNQRFERGIALPIVSFNSESHPMSRFSGKLDAVFKNIDAKRKSKFDVRRAIASDDRLDF